MHPKYQDNLKYKGPLINDIALAELETEVSFNDYMKPVCLPKSNIKFGPNKMCIVTGFGRTSGGSRQSTTLRKANVTIVDYKTCTQIYRPGTLTAQNVCAGSKEQGSCRGDSGGPLVCQEYGKYYLAGVVSFGKKSCRRTQVYAKVDIFMNWIKETKNTFTNDDDDY